MSTNTQDFDTAALNELLLAAFMDEKHLRRFCRDTPEFPRVLDFVSPGAGRQDHVDVLIAYSQTYLILEELLAAVERDNPRQYARFEPRLHPAKLGDHTPVRPVPDPSDPGPDQTFPEIHTITSPIRLELVQVPAGDFEMGSDRDKDENAAHDELPLHLVHVPEFQIGSYPVTNFQYWTFVRFTGHRRPRHWNMPLFRLHRKAIHPVVNISWEDATAFCAWLSRETDHFFRLPTEAEWEKAARGTDGRIYPWGNEPPDENLCNFNNNVRGSTPAGRYSPQGDSPYGCTDMAGNVFELCQSLYRPYPYHAGDGREDLQEKGARVLRGGTWSSHPKHIRCACRNRPYPSHSGGNYGFRVVLAPGT